MDELKRKAIKTIAEKMGWSGLQEAEAYISEVWFGLAPGEMLSMIDEVSSGWFGWPPGTKRSWTEIGPESPDLEPVPGMCKHKKSGGYYEVICLAQEESTLTDVVVYRSAETGLVWTRPLAEFCDGRFEMEDPEK